MDNYGLFMDNSGNASYWLICVDALGLCTYQGTKIFYIIFAQHLSALKLVLFGYFLKIKSTKLYPGGIRSHDPFLWSRRLPLCIPHLQGNLPSSAFVLLNCKNNSKRFGFKKIRSKLMTVFLQGSWHMYIWVLSQPEWLMHGEITTSSRLSLTLLNNENQKGL
jgi:hypothetical protein